MSVTFLAVVFISIVTSIVAVIWHILLYRSDPQFASQSFGCPHLDAEDFSGGYRDAARQGIKCNYVVRCTLKGYGVPRCPTHHCNLVKHDHHCRVKHG